MRKNIPCLLHIHIFIYCSLKFSLSAFNENDFNPCDRGNAVCMVNTIFIRQPLTRKLLSAQGIRIDGF